MSKCDRSSGVTIQKTSATSNFCQPVVRSRGTGSNNNNFVTPNRNNNSQISSTVEVEHDCSIKKSGQLHSDMESVASNVSLTNHAAHNFISTDSALPETHDNFERNHH